MGVTLLAADLGRSRRWGEAAQRLGLSLAVGPPETSLECGRRVRLVRILCDEAGAGHPAVRKAAAETGCVVVVRDARWWAEPRADRLPPAGPDPSLACDVCCLTEPPPDLLAAWLEAGLGVRVYQTGPTPDHVGTIDPGLVRVALASAGRSYCPTPGDRLDCLTAGGRPLGEPHLDPVLSRDRIPTFDADLEGLCA